MSHDNSHYLKKFDKFVVAPFNLLPQNLLNKIFGFIYFYYQQILIINLLIFVNKRIKTYDLTSLPSSHYHQVIVIYLKKISFILTLRKVSFPFLFHKLLSWQVYEHLTYLSNRVKVSQVINQ